MVRLRVPVFHFSADLVFLFQFQYGAIKGRSTTTKIIMIFNQLRIICFLFSSKKLSTPDDPFLPGYRQPWLFSLFSACQRTIAAKLTMISPVLPARLNCTDNTSLMYRLILEHIIKLAQFFPNNLFFEPFLLSGLKDN